MFCSFVVDYGLRLWCWFMVFCDLLMVVCLGLWFYCWFGSCAVLGILVVAGGCLRGALVASSVLILLLPVQRCFGVWV